MADPGEVDFEATTRFLRTGPLDVLDVLDDPRVRETELTRSLPDEEARFNVTNSV